MWWMLLLACAGSQVEALDEEVAALRRAQVAQELRITALEEAMATQKVANAEGSEVGEPAAAAGEAPRMVTLREVAADVEGASRLGRLILHRDAKGEFDGVRVSAIRRGSALAVAGLANGDIVNEINGVALTSMEAMMVAYTELSKPDVVEIRVKLVRRGEAMELSRGLDVPLEVSNY